MKKLKLVNTVCGNKVKTMVLLLGMGMPLTSQMPMVGASRAVAASEMSMFQLGVEGLGAALLYSVFGSFRPVKHVAANLGFSTFNVSSSSSSGLGTSSGSVSMMQVPVSISFLLGGDNSFLEILGGGDLIFASDKATLPIGSSKTSSANTILPEFGIGFRYWPLTGGFHARATLYTIFAGGSVLPWPGLSVGYAF